MFIASNSTKEQISTIKLLAQANIQGNFRVVNMETYKEGFKVIK